MVHSIQSPLAPSDIVVYMCLCMYYGCVCAFISQSPYSKYSPTQGIVMVFWKHLRPKDEPFEYTASCNLAGRLLPPDVSKYKPSDDLGATAMDDEEVGRRNGGIPAHLHGDHGDNGGSNQDSQQQRQTPRGCHHGDDESSVLPEWARDPETPVNKDNYAFRQDLLPPGVLSSQAHLHLHPHDTPGIGSYLAEDISNGAAASYLLQEVIAEKLRKGMRLMEIKGYVFIAIGLLLNALWVGALTVLSPRLTYDPK